VVPGAHAYALEQGFELAGTTYRVGDCVALRPEDEVDDWYAVIDELYEVRQPSPTFPHSLFRVSTCHDQERL
jgi:hypothetical protein